ncbi:MAG: cyclic nucleotide-binding domain-containing protein, partial [Bacteroidota bacterium]
MNQLSEHIRSLSSISADRLAAILAEFVEKRFAKKDHLLYADGYAKEVYFLLSGCVRTYVYDLNGVEHNITFSTENWWFGDLQSFINETPASFNIQALESTTVLAISKEKWKLLLREVPEFLGYTRILFRNTMF